MYETRREAAAACEYEAAAAAHYSKAAVYCAQHGECSRAQKLADTARVAATCAMQAHEALWALAGEDMTGEEFKAFEKAEIAQIDAMRAEREAAAAVEKRREQPELDPALAALCEETGAGKEGIAALMAYYTERCGWPEEKAAGHIRELFENGTIAALMQL